MDLTELQIDCHYLAKEKGFWPEGEQRNVPEMLALIHSEISEALEEYRKGVGHRRMSTTGRTDGKPEGFGVELADAVIRILDLAEGLQINLADRIREKLEFNRTRPHKHGKVC
jgi:NTP pyrophosphatase (non-canonical NTP hydrolase)